jgi:hypothetical protein
MQHGKRIRVYATLAVAAAAMGGCLSTNYAPQWTPVEQTAPGGDVTLYRDVSFSDIPIPAEFALIDDESYSFQGAKFRTGVFRYAGSVDWSEALDYFRTAIPANGWILEKTDRGIADRAFTFSKGPERLIIVVRQVRNGTQLELQLDNIAQNDLLLKGKLKNE